nr:hypothetical protein [Tanacetum cinerariifolium]
MLLAKKDSDEQVLLAEDQAWMESSSDSDQKINVNMVFMAQIEKVLLESDESSSSGEETIAEVAYYTSESISESEFKTSKYYDNSTNYGLFVNNDDDQEFFHDAIESASENFIENHIDSQKDYDKSEVDHNDSEEKEHLQTSSLKPYVLNVILEKIIIDLEDEVVNLLEKEKANLEIIESLKSKGFESSENEISETENQSENDCHVVEKECDNVENPKVIAPGMFKLSVSQSVSPMSMSKTSCESNNVEIKLKRKRHTFSSVRRPKHSGVIWKKKWSSNTPNVDLSAVSHLKLNKNTKRYSRKDLLVCNNSHLGETSSAYVCNDSMNVSCNSRMCDLLDGNNFFIFDDKSINISLVSRMPFRKKPRDSINVRSKSNMIKSLPRTMRKWLPKLQPLAEPVAKWFPRVVQIYLWIIDLGCSKHMTGNRALLTNFTEKFLGTVRFGNNDFAVIAGYGDVVIGSMTIKKSTCFVRNEDGVDLLTGDRSLNVYTIALNEVASNSSTCLLAKASSSKSWLWHQRLSHLNFAIINNLVKNNLVQVQRVQTDNGMEFKNKTLAKFIDEIMKSSTTNVNTLINEEVFHEVSESFQGESSSSSLNDDVQQSSEEVILPQTNTQSISNNMIPNVDEEILTPMVEQAKLKLDLVGKPVDHTDYRSMIGSLMYVTSSRPDIMFATCDKLVCWSSKKQNCMSISTAKSEYVAVSSCCAQVLWMPYSTNGLWLLL